MLDNPNNKDYALRRRGSAMAFMLPIDEEDAKKTWDYMKRSYQGDSAPDCWRGDIGRDLASQLPKDPADAAIVASAIWSAYLWLRTLSVWALAIPVAEMLLYPL